MGENRHLYFMGQALSLAEAALERGEFPVGCVLVYRGEVVATGARQGTASPTACETDHAEMVALRRLDALDRRLDPEKIILYSTMEPCLMCYGAILIGGIGTVVYGYEDVMGGATRCDLSGLPPLYRSRRITVVPHVLRGESLRLFQAFFQNPDNGYWRESLLSRYTLRQSGKEKPTG